LHSETDEHHVSQDSWRLASDLIKGPFECEAAERDVWFSVASIRFLRTCVSRVMRIHRVHPDVEFDVTFSLPELLFAITRKG